MADGGDGWKNSLVFCILFSWLIGTCVFGLALGTLKDEAMDMRLSSRLLPLAAIACADVANGIFIWILTFWGVLTLIYRNNLCYVPYLTGLVLNFILQTCTGISTLVLCSYLVDDWKRLSISLCEKSLNPHQLAFAKYRNLQVDSGFVDKNQFNKTLSSIRKSLLSSADVQLCSNFNDLMTPCGSLLIVGAIVYILHLVCAFCLYTNEKDRKQKT